MRHDGFKRRMYDVFDLTPDLQVMPSKRDRCRPVNRLTTALVDRFTSAR